MTSIPQILDFIAHALIIVLLPLTLFIDRNQQKTNQNLKIEVTKLKIKVAALSNKLEDGYK